MPGDSRPRVVAGTFRGTPPGSGTIASSSARCIAMITAARCLTTCTLCCLRTICPSNRAANARPHAGAPNRRPQEQWFNSNSGVDGSQKFALSQRTRRLAVVAPECAGRFPARGQIQDRVYPSVETALPRRVRDRGAVCGGLGTPKDRLMGQRPARRPRCRVSPRHHRVRCGARAHCDACADNAAIPTAKAAAALPLIELRTAYPTDRVAIIPGTPLRP